MENRLDTHLILRVSCFFKKMIICFFPFAIVKYESHILFNLYRFLFNKKSKSGTVTKTLINTLQWELFSRFHLLFPRYFGFQFGRLHLENKIKEYIAQLCACC